MRICTDLYPHVLTVVMISPSPVVYTYRGIEFYPLTGHRVMQISVLRSAHAFGVLLKTTYLHMRPAKGYLALTRLKVTIFSLWRVRDLSRDSQI